MYKRPSYETGGVATVEAKGFGDHFAADHVVIYRDKDTVIEDSWLVVKDVARLVVKDVATQFTYAYPSGLKSTEECVSALQHFTTSKDFEVFTVTEPQSLKKS